jgi:Spy/CpxP family protein refolding chaperone
MESTDMKKLFAALIAALFAAVTFSAVAADTAAKPADSAKPAKTAKKHHKKVAPKVEEPAAPAKK